MEYRVEDMDDLGALLNAVISEIDNTKTKRMRFCNEMDNINEAAKQVSTTVGLSIENVFNLIKAFQYLRLI